jgi:hypothetical protein
MALADILEALTAGGSAGLGAYARERELERERAERERVRQEEARYRQQLLDMRQRENERAEARDRASERASMAAAGYRTAREGEPTGPMMFQPRGVEIQEFDFAPSSFAPPAPDVEEGRIRGTGAAAAPGQTYSAVARALEEEKPTVRTRTVDGPDIYLPAPEDRGFDFIEGAYGSYLRPSSELLARADRQRVAREAEEKRLQDIADEVAAEERQFGTAKELAEYETGLRERLAQFEKNLEDDRLDKLREDLRNWELNFLREMDRPPSLDEIRVQAGMYGAQYEIPPEEMARFMGARQTDSDAGGGEGAGAPEAPPAPRTAESILQNIIQSRESAAMESQRIEAARQNAAEQARLLEEALRMSQLQGIPLSASETANLFDEMNAFRREAGLLPLLRMPQ